MIERAAVDSGDASTDTAAGRLRIPPDPAYIEALGRAFHHFTYLEWVVVSTIAKLSNNGYGALTKGRTAGYLAKKLLEAIDSSSPALSSGLRQRLTRFHRSFVRAKHRRDRLVHARPYTAIQSLPRLGNGHHEWATEKLNLAATQFEEAAIEGEDIFHGDLTRELLRIGWDHSERSD